MVVLSIVIIAGFYNILKPSKVLPIYQPAQVNVELVDSTIQHQKKYHTIADFKLINQNGDTITEAFYKDKIYICGLLLLGIFTSTYFCDFIRKFKKMH